MNFNVIIVLLVIFSPHKYWILSHRYFLIQKKLIFKKSKRIFHFHCVHVSSTNVIIGSFALNFSYQQFIRWKEEINTETKINFPIPIAFSQIIGSLIAAYRKILKFMSAAVSNGMQTFPPWTTAPRTIAPMKFPPGQFSPGQLPLTNSPWTTAPRKIAPPWNSPQDNSSPDFRPPGQLPLTNSLLDNCPPGQWPPTKFPSG